MMLIISINCRLDRNCQNGNSQLNSKIATGLECFVFISCLHSIHFLIFLFLSSIQMLKWLSLLVWIISILFCAIFALIITIWIWQRLQSTPTLITIDSLYYPISNTPFPSVTLCNMNIVYRSSMENNFLNKM